MGDVRIALGVAACLTTFATGYATTSVGQVQEVGPGTYSIDVSVSHHGLGGQSQEKNALDAAVDKAGEYYHSKGQKLLNHAELSEPKQRHFPLPLPGVGCHTKKRQSARWNRLRDANKADSRNA
jgi:hypothetical protein